MSREAKYRTVGFMSELGTLGWARRVRWTHWAMEPTRVVPDPFRSVTASARSDPLAGRDLRCYPADTVQSCQQWPKTDPLAAATVTSPKTSPQRRKGLLEVTINEAPS